MAAHESHGQREGWCVRAVARRDALAYSSCMARDLIKLPCGIIHTAEFADYLRLLHAREIGRHRHEVLALDYIRCGSGPQKGTAWWQLAWIPEQNAPPIHRQRIGDTDVFIHRQSLRGLRGRCLHCEGEQVVVLR